MENADNRLARAYIDAAVSELKHTYIDFIYPLSMMEWREQQGNADSCLSTDGITVYYKPDLVLRCGKAFLQYSIIHIIMHGLLGHFQIKDEYPEKDYRDLMMDIQVGYLMFRLNIFPAFNRTRVFEKILNNDYSMGQYYQLPQIREFGVRLDYYKSICKVDNHGVWDKEKEDAKKKQVTVFWKNVRSVVLGEETDKSGKENNGEIQYIARVLSCRNARVLSCRNADGTQAGKESGAEEKVFAVGKYGTQDYRELFKPLFCVREVSVEEPDSIDNMLYHYGLELYENVPLIEPLENCEKPAFHTLVIAIDVSGSCVEEETVESFWAEAFLCISQLKEQYADGEVLLLQCDSKIQKEEIVRLAEFTELPKQVEVKGMGGTSFIPVFRRIEELQKEGMQIGALLYFTDGVGEYPKEASAYPVYFVTPDTSEGAGPRFRMPDWIHRVVLEK